MARRATFANRRSLVEQHHRRFVPSRQEETALLAQDYAENLALIASVRRVRAGLLGAIGGVCTGFANGHRRKDSDGNEGRHRRADTRNAVHPKFRHPRPPV